MIIELAPPEVEVRPTADGGLVLSSPLALGPFPARVGDVLVRWAVETPRRTFLAERTPEGSWRTVDYAAARDRVRRLAQALLDRGLHAARPLLLLSGNGIDHALLQLAAMEAGIPAAPISPAWSLMSRDLGKVRLVAEVLRPGAVYAADGEAFARALEALDLPAVVSVRAPAGTETVDDLLRTEPGDRLEEAAAAVGPDTVAKVLFTSGSTGTPKGVLNTHRMLCSNQAAIARLWPFLSRRPPVLVDWLPWSHTFGGNHNLNLVLFHGGTLWIDEGKPAPGLFAATVRNLREVPSTLHFNVPRGFAMLVPELERDTALREVFFSELDALFFAGAALPRNLWDRLSDLSASVRGEPVPFLTAWGSTETAPLATSVHFPTDRPEVIGLPAPGVEVKLAPAGDRLELRVRGPNVTPGYWGDPELTAAAFDADGFFRMGDAGKLADPDDPAGGLVFDGRIAENFKLVSGTWVPVGEVRTGVIAACAPLIADAVVTGHDRDEVGLLVFPSLDGCREIAGVPDASLRDLVTHPGVHLRLVEGLRAWNASQPGSSRRVARALLMTEPPDVDAGEITDKGYLNQRAVLDRRAGLVTRLYGDGGPDVVEV